MHCTAWYMNMKFRPNCAWSVDGPIRDAIREGGKDERTLVGVNLADRKQVTSRTTVVPAEVKIHLMAKQPLSGISAGPVLEPSSGTSPHRDPDRLPYGDTNDKDHSLTKFAIDRFAALQYRDDEFVRYPTDDHR